MAPKGNLEGAISAYQAALEHCELGETPNATHIAREYGCNHTTLSRRVGGYTRSARQAKEDAQALTPAEETSLVDYIRLASSSGHPPTPADVTELATVLRDNRVLLSHDAGLPSLPPPIGVHWVDRFRGRHNDVLRTTWSRHLDNERLKANNRAGLEAWFVAVKSMRDTHHYEAGDIYNMDETGFSIGGPTRSTRVVVGIERGRTKTGKAKKGGSPRGEWTTCIECISASGRALKPLIVFKGKWMTTGYVPDSPLVVFQPQTLTNPPCRRLLITDGHGSHVTYRFIAFCVENNIDLMVLPPHSSALTQPLDVGVFGPLKMRFDRLMDTRARSLNSGRLTKVEFATYVARARKNAFSERNILAGWAAAGLEPFRPSVLLGPHSLDGTAPHTPPRAPSTPLPLLSSDTRLLIESQVEHLLTPVKNRLVELSVALEAATAENVLLKKDRDERQAQQDQATRAAPAISIRGGGNHVFTSERVLGIAKGVEGRKLGKKGGMVVVQAVPGGE